MQQLLTDLERSRAKVDQLLDDRNERLTNNLDTAKKFEQDHK